MEQGRNQQQLSSPPPVLAAASETKAPAVSSQQPKPAAPVMPVPRQWPMAFNPLKPSTEVKSVTPKKKKHCNCRNSKCLKMYCECFQELQYCDGCNCSNCGNIVGNENARNEAIEAIRQRNPSAFQPKIENGPNTLNVRKDNSGAVPVVAKHHKGCHCKKSGCLKKYCECYQANVFCSKNCRCMHCKNSEGNEDTETSSQRDHASDRSHIQQAANVAFNGTVGSSGYICSLSRKRSHEDALGVRIKSEGSMPETQTQYQQGNHADVSPLAPCSTGFDRHNAANSKSNNPIYRSPLANTIHLREVNDLVKHLVMVCRMAEAKIAEEKGFQSNNGLSNGNCKQQDFKETSSIDILSKGCSHQPNINEMGFHWSETSNVSRPASPTTQSLMCDEQNTTFGNEPASPTTQALMCEEQNTTFGNEPASPTTQALMCEEQNTTFGNDYKSSFPLVSRGQDISEINAVQENLVLTGLRQYLCTIIRRGRTNEQNSSLEATMELDAGQHHGAPPAFSAIETEENFPSSSTIETPRTNQQPTPNGGSKDSIAS
ncbi:hypothetical protein BDA96_04G131900 [Sorghum bicolor]|uniref:CRC domain-containing protein n=2 Tax=Sorghum bicolor TaxID=4558 RepID=A0A921R3Z1_SORBI|nr:protein tesmin/TSO1-like CXC 5 isoform X1 [Sorghum bicolor]KAG0532728.1 hypothetical protein BDA96_04G131900 [Sorghum bicolor]KXG30022.1 hypothetical protein SORBI_3004G124300 [Sorghum bicolor]|eukprot:XP_002453686.2 protein tesmin/TSO1-like CXC 5 isoform X1 [Sorghum bicolor]